MTNVTISRIDNLVTPLGFFRDGMTWNRNTNGFVDVLDLQLSKGRDACTVNVGVMNHAVYRICWGTEPPDFIDESSCVIRTRIGHLADGRDTWWPLTGSEAEIVSKISEHALPFAERMHSIRAMEAYLTQARVIERKYPLPIIYLAIIKSLSGDIVDACEILTKVTHSVVGPWRIRASEAARRIGCVRKG
jgi:Domain of unknown function (DUF4304)